jgi:hypothetical protein
MPSLSFRTSSSFACQPPGSPGSVLAQRHFRHKTRKLAFLIPFWVMAALHVALVGAVAYKILAPTQLEGSNVVGR